MLVAPHHVHRSRSDQTLLATARAIDANTSTAEVKPELTSGSYYRDHVRGRSMALMRGIEAIRQLETLSAHLYYGVSHDAKFVLREWEFSANCVNDAPSSVGFVSLLRDTPADRGRTVEYVGTATLVEIKVCMERLVVSYVTPEIYKAIRYRGSAPTVLSAHTNVRNYCAPADHVRLGLDAPDHVAVGHDRANGHLCVAADTGNPAYFDHVQDHWPGMVLTEAAIQAAHLHLGRVSPCTAVRARFDRYLELSIPVHIEIGDVTESGGLVELAVGFVQAGSLGASMKLTFES